MSQKRPGFFSFEVDVWVNDISQRAMPMIYQDTSVEDALRVIFDGFATHMRGRDLIMGDVSIRPNSEDSLTDYTLEATFVAPLIKEGHSA